MITSEAAVVCNSISHNKYEKFWGKLFWEQELFQKLSTISFIADRPFFFPAQSYAKLATFLISP